MKHLTFALAALPLLGSAALAQRSVSVADLPPVVVQTVPQGGSLAVDPSLEAIKVTFSKDMMTREMWSWVQITEVSFPPLAGKVHFLADQRTCVLPVHLEPGRSYAVWVNSEQHNNFRDLGNRPAVPYLIVFQTKP